MGMKKKIGKIARKTRKVAGKAEKLTEGAIKVAKVLTPVLAAIAGSQSTQSENS